MDHYFGDEFSPSKYEYLSKNFGDAFFEDQYPFLDPGLSGFLIQQPQRFVHGLVREAEGSVVHRNHPARVQIEKGASGVGGTGMDIAKRRRVVSADGQKRQLRGQAHTDFSETGEI